MIVYKIRSLKIRISEHTDVFKYFYCKKKTAVHQSLLKDLKKVTFQLNDHHKNSN